MLSLSILFAACGAPKQKFTDAKAGTGFAAKLDWAKKKTKHIDLQLTFTNSLDKPVQVLNEAFSLTFKGEPTRFSKRDGVTVIQPGQVARQLVIFDMPANKSDGKIVLTIDKLTTADEGKKPGSVPALKIEADLKSPI